MDEVNNLAEMLASASLRYPHKTALVFGSKKITYSRLQSISLKLASGLYGLGVRKNDKVAVWLANCPEFVYSFFATVKLGATVVPVNNMLKREEAKFIIEDSGAKILISSVDKITDSENILSRLESLKNIISVPTAENNILSLNFYSLINDIGEFKEDTAIAQDDLAEIIYTSGTTGKPKGACLSHKNILSNVKDCAGLINLTSRDSTICILPLFHSFASTVCMLMPIYKGAKIVIMRAVKPFKRVIRAIFKHRVTILVGVPSLFNILSEVKLPFLSRLLNLLFNPVRLCISGAAALPFEVWYKFEKKFKRPLIQGYGLTEASPVVSLNPLKGKRKPESVGLALASDEIRIADINGKDLGIDCIGELLVKGPNVMAGYYKLEEENKKTLENGWLHTGDLAKIDHEGFIYIMGRIKEMINVRGLNVYPREIEDLLYKYPGIKEAAVVGIEHRHRGEAPVAFIVKSADLKERDIIKYLRENLAPYKVPLKVIFKDSLPKNTTGKILKRELQAEIENLFR
ncbi:MAG: long-chain fatty acid--CoA ligase [Candidatus Omnitrophota bacterium]|nr:long-chain fatty acid--CoA ligase [Candidatus Omnitrophota bacterium]